MPVTASDDVRKPCLLQDLSCHWSRAVSNTERWSKTWFAWLVLSSCFSWKLLLYMMFVSTSQGLSTIPCQETQATQFFSFPPALSTCGVAPSLQTCRSRFKRSKKTNTMIPWFIISMIQWFEFQTCNRARRNNYEMYDMFCWVIETAGPASPQSWQMHWLVSVSLDQVTAVLGRPQRKCAAVSTLPRHRCLDHCQWPKWLSGTCFNSESKLARSGSLFGFESLSRPKLNLYDHKGDASTYVYIYIYL